MLGVQCHLGPGQMSAPVGLPFCYDWYEWLYYVVSAPALAGIKSYIGGAHISTVASSGFYVNGDIQATNHTIMADDRWHVSADGKIRFWFTTNARTYFGSQGGYT